ncbi:MAG TPA: hypothetical protein VHE61_15945 [Opitutaceae bacterium]|nr:hypothetical protein [Opitutaceae bacterium]
MKMADAEIQCLRRAVSVGGEFLEYGAGGSTTLICREPNVAHVVSVESDAKFVHDHVRVDAEKQALLRSGRLRFLLPDIGPTGEWGYPRDARKAHLWPNYALCPYMHGYTPTIVLVDGRFRVACAIVAALEAPQSVVLIHDYPNRAQYHVIERFFDIEEEVGTLVRCRRKAVFDEAEARQLLRIYLYAPGDTPGFDSTPGAAFRVSIAPA